MSDSLDATLPRISILDGIQGHQRGRGRHAQRWAGPQSCPFVADWRDQRIDTGMESASLTGPSLHDSELPNFSVMREYETQR